MPTRHEILITLGLMMIVLALIIIPGKGFAEPAVQTKLVPSSEVPWPYMYGQVGPYGVKDASDVSAIAAAGFHMVKISYPGTSGPMIDSLSQNNTKYIDPFIWNTISNTVNKGKMSKLPYTLSEAQENAVLAITKKHLTETAQDPHIAAYYILDDYPGTDIHGLLEKIHTLVAASNQTSIFPRPTICGFAGYLDRKNDIASLFTSTTEGFSVAIVNFSPVACDMVALYPYGTYVKDPQLIDWSMSTLLPAELQLLRDKGWDQSKQPLIGVPQTFSYQPGNFTSPTPEDVATQVESYCKAGAVALMPYAWNDFFTGPKTELFNSPELLQGFQKGVEICRSQYWTAHIDTTHVDTVHAVDTVVPADTVSPTISLIGDNPMTISVGDTFTDPGATAHDEVDGDVTNSITVSGPVDTSTAGDYTVTYQVKDAAGNGGSALRKVIVNPVNVSVSSPTDVDPTPSDPIASVVSTITNLFVKPATTVPVIVKPVQSIQQGTWKFIPASSSNTVTSKPSSTDPTVNTMAGKKDYTIKAVDYVLNNVMVHHSDTFPDNWTLDTSTLADGKYVLSTTLYYADGRTDVNTQLLTVNNTPTLIDRVITFVQNLFKK